MDEKKKASWKLDGNGIQVCRLPQGTELKFDLTRIFPNFGELTDTQQEIIAYGVKQKCSDRTARSAGEKLDEGGLEVVMLETFEQIVDGSAWKRTGSGQKSVKTQIREGAKVLAPQELEALKALLAKSGVNIF